VALEKSARTSHCNLKEECELSGFSQATVKCSVRTSETSPIFWKMKQKLKRPLDLEGLSGYPEDSEIDRTGEK
jgi:hypothetical protein